MPITNLTCQLVWPIKVGERVYKSRSSFAVSMSLTCTVVVHLAEGDTWGSLGSPALLLHFRANHISYLHSGPQLSRRECVTWGTLMRVQLRQSRIAVSLPSKSHFTLAHWSSICQDVKGDLGALMRVQPRQSSIAVPFLRKNHMSYLHSGPHSVKMQVTWGALMRVQLRQSRIAVSLPSKSHFTLALGSSICQDVKGYLGGIDEGARRAGPAAEFGGLLCSCCCSFWRHPSSPSLSAMSHVFGDARHMYSYVSLESSEASARHCQPIPSHDRASWLFSSVCGTMLCFAYIQLWKPIGL